MYDDSENELRKYKEENKILLEEKKSLEKVKFIKKKRK